MYNLVERKERLIRSNTNNLRISFCRRWSLELISRNLRHLKNLFSVFTFRSTLDHKRICSINRAFLWVDNDVKYIWVVLYQSLGNRLQRNWKLKIDFVLVSLYKVSNFNNSRVLHETFAWQNWKKKQLSKKAFWATLLQSKHNFSFFSLFPRRGKGIPALMDYTGRLCSKGVYFSDYRPGYIER